MGEREDHCFLCAYFSTTDVGDVFQSDSRNAHL